jgi:glycogen synthase
MFGAGRARHWRAKRMHILVTADTVGGVWTYARELVTGLVRRGARVTLVSFGEIPTATQTEWMDGLRNFDFHPTAFRLEWMQEAPADIETSTDYLRGVIDEAKPDLLHLNQFCYGGLEVSIPKLVVAHSDVVSWWRAVKGIEPPADEWNLWYRRVVREGLAGADAVVAPTQWMLDETGKNYGPPKSGTVIYNGRSVNLFNPHVSKESYALTVGRIWDAGKQASLLTRFEPSMPILIVGAEQHADEAFRGDDAPEHETLPQVHFKGPQTEGQLRHLFSRASMYVATSRYEPFGLAPVEAALSRCAIVANDIPSLREVWGQAACYFQENDPISLCETIERLHSDREMRLTYANLAYNRARQWFTADRMVEDYMNLYQSLVGAETIAA